MGNWSGSLEGPRDLPELPSEMLEEILSHVDIATLYDARFLSKTHHKLITKVYLNYFLSKLPEELIFSRLPPVLNTLPPRVFRNVFRHPKIAAHFKSLTGLFSNGIHPSVPKSIMKEFEFDLMLTFLGLCRNVKSIILYDSQSGKEQCHAIMAAISNGCPNLEFIYCESNNIKADHLILLISKCPQLQYYSFPNQFLGGSNGVDLALYPSFVPWVPTKTDQYFHYDEDTKWPVGKIEKRPHIFKPLTNAEIERIPPNILREKDLFADFTYTKNPDGDDEEEIGARDRARVQLPDPVEDDAEPWHMEVDYPQNGS